MNAFLVLVVIFAAAPVYLARRGPSTTRRRALVGLGLALLLAVTGWSHGDTDPLLRWERPGFVVLAALAWAAAAPRREALARSLSGWRASAVWVSLVLTSTAALLSAAGPSTGRRVDQLTVVFAVDRSRSMELAREDALAARGEEALAVQRMRPRDRVGRVVFGAEAATEDPVHARELPPSAQESAVGRAGTDLAAGLRRALAELPEGGSARVVLVTDGEGNRGDLAAAGAAAAAAGVPVDLRRVRSVVRANVRLDSVRAPGSVDEGETFELRLLVRSTDSGAVTARVRQDGQPVWQGAVRVEPGERLTSLRVVAPAPGLHRYEVELVAQDPTLDERVEDNLGGAFVRVRGTSSALVLEGDPGAAEPLQRALEGSGGFRVEVRGPNSFPEDLADLARYDLVVLSDVPARNLGPDQLEALRTYVRDLGGGLWLLGGDRSLGPGGYARTPVEDLSPVRFDLRQERRRASLSEVIAIDYSGSMTAQVGPHTKIQLANEAAARSAMLLGPGDRLGVAHVDTQTRWTVPLGPIADLGAVVQRIRAVSAGGGGIIVPISLADGYAALRRERTNLRHLLLFADGADAEQLQGCAATVGQAYREGITTSVVSLGRGADTPELEHLSREGHGRFYLVEDALRLPTVFAQETVLAARASLREERFRPSLGAPDVVTQGVDFSTAPALRGYVVTIPRPRASVLLTGPDGDPVLATWQVGVGRTAVFTSDAKDRWGAEWLRWPGATQLWVSLARSLVRRDDGLVRVDADTTGAVLHVRATATTRDGHGDGLRRLTARVSAPDGTLLDLALDPDGGGTYSCERAVSLRGAYTVAVRDDVHGAIVASTGTSLWASEEFRGTGDASAVERVVALTGGRILPSATKAFDLRGHPRRAWVSLTPALRVLALLALVASVLLRRLSLPEVLQRRVWGRAGKAPRPARRHLSGPLQHLLASRRGSLPPLAPARPLASPTPATTPPPAGTTAPVSPPGNPTSTVARVLAQKSTHQHIAEPTSPTFTLVPPEVPPSPGELEGPRPREAQAEGGPMVSGSVGVLLTRKRARR